MREPTQNDYQRIEEYKNGYSASTVSHKRSYGGRDNEGLFEIALIHGEGLCYTPPVLGHDVKGWLTFSQVATLLTEIESLPANELCNHKREETP